MTSFQRLLTVVVLAGISAANFGCATTTEVREIVAASNAALVDVPSLATKADPADPNAWKQPVARIDRLISQNPDQEVLNSTLRVRQAMVLTTYGQFAAARQVWEQVDRTQLVSERDKALYDLHTDLVWWFEVAPDPSFGNARMDTAATAVAKFAEVNDGLSPGSDIRFYLETMRALIVLKVANSENTLNSVEAQQRVTQSMVGGLERLAALYTESGDTQWIEDNFLGDESQFDQPLERLRALAWLLETMREYKRVAAEKGLSPVWEPAWIRELLGS